MAGSSTDAKKKWRVKRRRIRLYTYERMQEQQQQQRRPEMVLQEATAVACAQGRSLHYSTGVLHLLPALPSCASVLPAWFPCLFVLTLAFAQ